MLVGGIAVSFHCTATARHKSSLKTYTDEISTRHCLIVSIAKRGSVLDQVAKIFIHGRSQVVLLPATFRFDTNQVLVRQDPETGDVILSRKPSSWDGFFKALQGADVPPDFLDDKDRNPGVQDTDPLEGLDD